MDNLAEAKEWLEKLIKIRNTFTKETKTEIKYSIINAILDARFYFKLHYLVYSGTYANDHKLERKIDIQQFSYGMFYTTIRTTTIKY